MKKKKQKKNFVRFLFVGNICEKIVNLYMIYWKGRKKRKNEVGKYAFEILHDETKLLKDAYIRGSIWYIKLMATSGMTGSDTTFISVVFTVCVVA